jgi:hypothetical protein
MKKVKYIVEHNNELNYTKVRTFGKSELALLYSPDSQPKVAVATLNRWIRRNKELAKALAAIGYNNNRHTFFSREVALIFKYIGEP